MAMPSPGPGITVDDAGRIIEWRCLCTRDADSQIIDYNPDCPLGHEPNSGSLFDGSWADRLKK